jgi:RHH-type rel operon transcriptional repressor/antitoxin RelB
MAKQTAVRLSDETYERLQQAAARTGRSADSHIVQAIEEHLEDLEDLYHAEEALKRRQRGESRTYSLDELDRELGLDD